MDLYSIALFLHIVGALILIALLTVEGVSLRLGSDSALLNRVLGPISAVLILGPGLYMVATQAGWTAWVVVGIVAWVLIAVLGAVTGVTLMTGRLSRRSAAVSWAARVGVALGVVFIMTTKPGLALSVLAVVFGAVAGTAAGTIARRRVQPA